VSVESAKSDGLKTSFIFMSAAFRYILQPYAGRRSRGQCPACGKPGEFTRYLDTDTGELLPEEYGRCNRESNCGYHANPYIPAPGGQSFAQLAQLAATDTPAALAPRCPPAPRLAPAPLAFIPAKLYQASLGHYERNNLAKLLRVHFGLGVANDLLTQFHLGTSTHWPGACIFWLLDESGQVRGGQVVLYDETGHTVKSPQRCTTWVHTALARRCKQQGQPAPDWLPNYEQHGQKSPCLFGLPQLATARTGKPVALVESAKTAMLCAPYWPEFIWLATMGQSYLTAERLAPVKGRRLTLFPDAGSLDNWQQRAKKLQAQGFEVKVSADLETSVSPDEQAAGYDLADILLDDWPGYPPSWD
jgi:hypothetical protein